MSKTVVGLFDHYSQAQNAAAELEKLGFTSADVSMVASQGTRDAALGTDVPGTADTTAERAGVGAGVGAAVGGLAGLLVGIGALAIPGVGPIVAAGPIVSVLTGAGIGAAAGGLLGALTAIGVPEHRAAYYAEGVRQGGTLVTVRAADDQAEAAADVLERCGAVDVEKKAASWKTESGDSFASQFRANDTTGSAWSRDAAYATDTGDVQKIPVIQEDVKIGKREVENGRAVRVYSTVVETPVEKEVTLRDERVVVERRPVDRPAAPGELDNLRDQTIELTEHSEEAVVGKTARVVEEVVVGKQVGQHTETIRETERRTDVRVEDMADRQSTRTGTFESYDQSFRTNWQSTYGSSGKSYSEVLPAYRYGYDVAMDDGYRDRNWDDVESHLRTHWETQRPGTWESMKAAVRHAWDSVRGAHRTTTGGYGR